MSTDLPTLLRARLAFDESAAWHNADVQTCTQDRSSRQIAFASQRVEHARLAPLHEAMCKVVEAAERVRASRYPERAGTPELEQTLAALAREVGEGT